VEDTPPAGQPDEEPKRKSRKKKLPKVLPGAEVRALLAAADNGTPRGTRDRLMLELMYRAGLRVSEVTTLKPRDVESDGVVRLYDAKGGDGTAYFDAERLNPMIERWLAIRAGWTQDPAAPFFVRPDGKKVSVRYIQRLVTRLKETCAIRGKCTPHVLRHTMATEMLEEGFTLTEVQGALRHANLQTTAVYLHLRDEQLRRKISRRTPTDDEGR
jgi:site-specific recombinase XerD